MQGEWSSTGGRLLMWGRSFEGPGGGRGGGRAQLAEGQGRSDGGAGEKDVGVEG